jgi:hypothetical protein
MAKERDKRYHSGLEFATAFIAALPAELTADVDLLTPLPSSAKTESQTLILPHADETPQRRSADLR